MNKKRILNLLGLAQRARKNVTGEQLVLKQIQNKQAQIVFLASDSGKATQKKFIDKCNSYEIPLSMDFTRAELSVAIGQVRSSIAITDAGFGLKIKSLLFSK
ncbi:YlxQ-related RNA-binding protein [Ligilactobacillus cholophilus]|uniref:YlxQ-related RNA-binding protein n=1 Tax=Ligilactobacillus cholophilus TaxID=3050131 RepID=UPI0025B23D8B|nr:YlxQ-related RNA-binding protein [Ligilactobacillus cholophilus]